MPSHCLFCREQPRLRSVEHCADCGLEQPVGENGLCAACVDWRAGRREIANVDAAGNLLAAVFERAQLDGQVNENLHSGAKTPRWCEDCGLLTIQCGRKFVNAVTRIAEDTDGDAAAVMFFIAGITAAEPIAA